jgi:hypothetical protein
MLVRRLPLPTAVAVLLATMFVGCSTFYVDWDNHTIRRRPTPVKEAATKATSSPSRSDTVAPRVQSASVHQHKHKKPVSTPDMQEMSIQPDTTESAPPPPATSTISMATPGDTSGAAEKAIEATSQRLGRFDRSRLNEASRATYDEANGFLNQSKEALAEKDYVAASGFEQKASVLADRLQATVTAR